MGKNRMEDKDDRQSSKRPKNPLMYKDPIPGVTLAVNQKFLDKKLLARIVKECNTPFFYHKFMIRNIKDSDRNHILKTMLDFLYPITFKAIHFELTSIGAYFLSRNCQEVILKIASEKFEIPNPKYPGSAFKVLILCNYILTEEVPVPDCSENIMKVLRKRYNAKTQTVNLNVFSDDEDLEDYYPLFQTKFFFFLMTLVAEMTPKRVLLQNNSIRELEHLHPLKEFVEDLDLSNNKLGDVEGLEILHGFKKLKNLKLNGNPICAKYNSYNYVLEIKRICHHLEKLDDVDIKTPIFKKNFLCSSEAEDLAAQFLEHFFTVYDSNNRQDLEELYLENSLFSVNSKITPNQKNSDQIKLEHYGLKKPFMVAGVKDIMKLFREFPKTYHDPYPLVCDVILYTETNAAIIVTGIFREMTQILTFSRHFLFKRNGDEFRISNDQLHVSNALDRQIGWSFKFPTHIGMASSPLPYFQEQYRELEEVVHRITNMNYEFSQKYLDHCKYDLQKTLALFSQLHVRGEVPEKAFTKESTRPLALRAGEMLAKYRVRFIAFCDRIRQETYKAHNSITLKTIWETLDNERIQSCTDRAYWKDPSIRRIPVLIDIPHSLKESDRSSLLKSSIQATKSVEQEKTSLQKNKSPQSSKTKEPTQKPLSSKKSDKSLQNSRSKSSLININLSARSEGKLPATKSTKDKPTKESVSMRENKSKGLTIPVSKSKFESVTKSKDSLLKLSEKIEKFKEIAAQKVKELKKSSKEEPPAKVEGSPSGLSPEDLARYKALALEKAEKLRMAREGPKVVLSPEEIAKYEAIALENAEKLRQKYGSENESYSNQPETFPNFINPISNFPHPVRTPFPLQNHSMQLGYPMQPHYPMQPGFQMQPGHLIPPRHPMQLGYMMQPECQMQPRYPMQSGFPTQPAYSMQMKDIIQPVRLLSPQVQPASSLLPGNGIQTPIARIKPVPAPAPVASAAVLIAPPKLNTALPKLSTPPQAKAVKNKKVSKWDVADSSSSDSSKKTDSKPVSESDPAKKEKKELPNNSSPNEPVVSSAMADVEKSSGGRSRERRTENEERDRNRRLHTVESRRDNRRRSSNRRRSRSRSRGQRVSSRRIKQRSPRSRKESQRRRSRSITDPIRNSKEVIKSPQLAEEPTVENQNRTRSSSSMKSTIKRVDKSSKSSNTAAKKGTLTLTTKSSMLRNRLEKLDFLRSRYKVRENLKRAIAKIIQDIKANSGGNMDSDPIKREKVRCLRNQLKKLKLQMVKVTNTLLGKTSPSDNSSQRTKTSVIKAVRSTVAIDESENTVTDKSTEDRVVSEISLHPKKQADMAVVVTDKSNILKQKSTTPEESPTISTESSVEEKKKADNLQKEYIGGNSSLLKDTNVRISTILKSSKEVSSIIAPDESEKVIEAGSSKILEDSAPLVEKNTILIVESSDEENSELKSFAFGKDDKTQTDTEISTNETVAGNDIENKEEISYYGGTGNHICVATDSSLGENNRKTTLGKKSNVLLERTRKDRQLIIRLTKMDHRKKGKTSISAESRSNKEIKERKQSIILMEEKRRKLSTHKTLVIRLQQVPIEDNLSYRGTVSKSSNAEISSPRKKRAGINPMQRTNTKKVHQEKQKELLEDYKICSVGADTEKHEDDPPIGRSKNSHVEECVLDISNNDSEKNQETIVVEGSSDEETADDNDGSNKIAQYGVTSDHIIISDDSSDDEENVGNRHMLISNSTAVEIISSKKSRENDGTSVSLGQMDINNCTGTPESVCAEGNVTIKINEEISDKVTDITQEGVDNVESVSKDILISETEENISNIGVVSQYLKDLDQEDIEQSEEISLHTSNGQTKLPEVTNSMIENEIIESKSAKVLPSNINSPTNRGIVEESGVCNEKKPFLEEIEKSQTGMLNYDDDSGSEKQKKSTNEHEITLEIKQRPKAKIQETFDKNGSESNSTSETGQILEINLFQRKSAAFQEIIIVSESSDEETTVTPQDGKDSTQKDGSNYSIILDSTPEEMKNTKMKKGNEVFRIDEVQNFDRADIGDISEITSKNSNGRKDNFFEITASSEVGVNEDKNEISDKQESAFLECDVPEGDTVTGKPDDQTENISNIEFTIKNDNILNVSSIEVDILNIAEVEKNKNSEGEPKNNEELNRKVEAVGEDASAGNDSKNVKTPDEDTKLDGSIESSQESDITNLWETETIDLNESSTEIETSEETVVPGKQRTTPIEQSPKIDNSVIETSVTEKSCDEIGNVTFAASIAKNVQKSAFEDAISSIGFTSMVSNESRDCEEVTVLEKEELPVENILTETENSIESRQKTGQVINKNRKYNEYTGLSEKAKNDSEGATISNDNVPVDPTKSDVPSLAENITQTVTDEEIKTTDLTSNPNICTEGTLLVAGGVGEQSDVSKNLDVCRTNSKNAKTMLEKINLDMEIEPIITDNIKVDDEVVINTKSVVELDLEIKSGGRENESIETGTEDVTSDKIAETINVTSTATEMTTKVTDIAEVNIAGRPKADVVNFRMSSSGDSTEVIERKEMISEVEGTKRGETSLLESDDETEVITAAEVTNQAREHADSYIETEKK